LTIFSSDPKNYVIVSFGALTGVITGHLPTPLVQPNPTCTVYSPPDPAASVSVTLN
jgi:hypothetical protein